MKTETLGLLACPYCGGRFRTSPRFPTSGNDIQYGALTCACSNFPVVAGIPIFRREERVNVMCDTRDSVFRSGPPVGLLLELIRAGLHEKALLLLLVPPDRYQIRLSQALGLLPGSFRRRFRELVERSRPRRRRDAVLRSLNERTTALEVFDLYFRRLGMWPASLYNYFGFRFGQPRYLTGLSLASLLPTSSGPILDLACGAGHILHSWSMRRPGHPLVGLDRNFYLLYVAKRWIAPAADFVCSDADTGLPFGTGSFGDVFCSDAFHYFLRKVQCVAEIQRILDERGAVILSRFGNALVPPNEGYELSPDAYANLFHRLEHRLISDRVLLARYLQKQGPALKDPLPPEALAEEKWISLVAARDGMVFRDYRTFDAWPHALGGLRINPLYRECETDSAGNISLELHFPSEKYRSANSDCRAYMPERAQVSKRTLEDIEKGKRSPEADDLIQACVLVGMPEGYG